MGNLCRKIKKARAIQFVQMTTVEEKETAEEVRTRRMALIADVFDGKAITDAQKTELLAFFNQMNEYESNLVILKFNERKLLGTLYQFPENCIVVHKENGKSWWTFEPREKHAASNLLDLRYARNSSYCVVRAPNPINDPESDSDDEDEKQQQSEEEDEEESD